MKQNSDITNFSLDQKDMKEIDKLHKGRRYNDPGDFCENAFGTFYPLHE
jgi:D-xylose reductase